MAMKEFRKWYKENIEPCLPTKRPSIAKTFEEAREETWRAALEWTIEEIIGCLSPQDAIEMLREELGDT